MATRVITSRRAFLADVLAGGASAAGKPAAAMTCRKGPRGERVSLIGFGMMRFPTVDGKHCVTWEAGSSNAPVDQKEVNRMVRRALDGGLNYFDVAPAYCRGLAEGITGIALKASGYPRSRYYIATKLSNFARSTWTREKSEAMYRKSFKELQTDYIDFYLIHNIGPSVEDFHARFVDNGMLDFLLAERKAGRIRNLGFSFHGNAATWKLLLDLHAKYHWDFAQIQSNYVDWNHGKEERARNIDARVLYGDLHKRGIPAVVMEPLLGGRLAHPPKNVATKLAAHDPQATCAAWAFRFAATPPGILTVLSGMRKMEHVEENLKTFSPLKPIDAREHAVLEEAASTYLAGDAIPCNACDYCMPCPYGLDIPGILTCFNRNRDTGDAAFLRDYNVSIPKLRRAERCTGCGRCTPHCPQGIDIPREIRRVDAKVEGIRRHA